MRPKNNLVPAPQGKRALDVHWPKTAQFKVPIPKDEKQRLVALARYDILDTPREKGFDDIVVLASHLCETPIALIVLIDRDRQWFKASVGVRVKESPREFAVCAYTIMQRRLFIVPDATRDKRFASNPFVIAGPQFKFYAGMPLITPDNRALGTICVIDKIPRTLSPAQKRDLAALSRIVMTEMELRSTLRRERQFATRKMLQLKLHN